MQIEISKMCPICREYKSLTEYGVRIRNGVNIGQGYCRCCKRARDKVYSKCRRELLK